jgi:hypothetical protein
LADKISKAFLEHLAANQPQPVRPPQQPQHSIAQTIAGAANGVMTNLGDAAHASDRPGGWLSGVTNTLNARNQRISGEQDRAFQQDQERQKTAALVAKNQVETLQIARNIQHQDQEDQEASASRGKAYVDAMRVNHGVEDNISQADLTSRAQKNPDYLQTHYGRITGYEPVLDGEGKQKVDGNGRPVVSPLWSLVERQPLHPDEQHQVSQADHDEWLRNTGVEYPVGTKLTVDQFTALSGRSHALADTENLVNKDREIALSSEQRNQLRTDLSDGNIQHYIAMKPGSALGGLYQASKNADDHIKATQQQIQAAQQKGDQNTVQQLQEQLKTFQDESAKVNRVITNGFSDKDRDEYQKNVEKERHDQQEEAERQRAERDRNEGKAKQKIYDQAHQAWQDSLAANDFNPLAAREALRKSNPKALAALADEETRSAQVTESTDPLTGETRSTTKSKPTFFAVPGQNNTGSNPQTVADIAPAAADFQKQQDQQVQQQKQQDAQRQSEIDQRPAEPEKFGGGMSRIPATPNPDFNKAEAYIAAHPELDGPGRAAVRKQFASQQQQTQLPKPPQQGAQMPPQVAAQYLQANGGNKNAARKAAQAAGWSF